MPDNERKKICVLHGASLNGGDFLIYKRGRKLLEKYMCEDFDMVYIPRAGEIKEGGCDGIIILGGPIVTRRLHQQAKNIKDLIKKERRENKNTPITTLGVGVSGTDYPPYDKYFIDKESIEFWKGVYESSGLVSVRDVETKRVLEAYGIKARLTGCPALYNMMWEEIPRKEAKDSILISLPAGVSHNLWSVRYYYRHFPRILTAEYMLKTIKKSHKNMRIGVAFQHGYNTGDMLKLKKLAIKLGMETHDISGKSIEEAGILEKYSMHIGPRLHLHIAFLTSKKPSYLLDLDLRTHAFLKTIKTPHASFSRRGIKEMNRELNRIDHKAFENTERDIEHYRGELERFVMEMKLMFEEAL